MPLGPLSKDLIRAWLKERRSGAGQNIWDIRKEGIWTILARLEKQCGIPCNAHTYRRALAAMMRKQGIDSLDIMKSGGWKSLTMV